MKRRKAFVVPLCLIAVGSALAGCGSTSSSSGTTTASLAGSKQGPGSGQKVAFVCANASIPFFAPIEQGAKSAAAELGASLSYTGIGASNITGPAMATALTTAINQKPSALIYCNFFPTAEDPIIKQAVSQGIPAFATDAVTDWQADGAIDAFGQQSEVGGAQAGVEMAAAGVKHPLCVDDVPTNPDVAARCTGFASAFATKGIKARTLNLPANANNNPTAILTDVKGALASDSKIDGVLMLGEQQAVAAVQAVAQSGRTGQVKIGTFDVNSDVLTDVQNGTLMFTVWQQPYLQGYLPVLAAVQHAKYGMAPAGETETGPIFVTKANVAKVKAAQAAGLA